MLNPEFDNFLTVWRERLRRFPVCLAVSGGADSVAMLRLIASIAAEEKGSAPIFVGHVNHLSRGRESDDDALFVRQLCEEQGITCRVETVDRRALDKMATIEGSWEAAARNIRYKMLTAMTQDRGARYLLTAHTRDDQLETLVQRLFRGTGMRGLKGIPAIRPINDAVVLARPLLAISRKSLVEYLQSIGQNWRTDSSNRSQQFLRNRIRHRLRPVLENLFPNKWEESLLRLSATATEIDQFIDDELTKYKDLLPIVIGSEFRWNRKQLMQLSHFLLCEFFRRFWQKQQAELRDMGQTQWQRLATMVRNDHNTRSEFPGGIVVETNNNEVRIIFPNT